MNNILARGKKVLTAPQETILSAASVIMIMIVASRVLGLIRQRVLLSFFVPGELSLFFAAFRLPDLVFEVLTLGALSSAFIPVFTKLLKKDEKEAWETASRVVNLGLAMFIVVALVFGLMAHWLYQRVAPGYSLVETNEIANLARILFAAQGFFVVSYVVTGVLESKRRFLMPALAPLFYNLGIIVGTVLLSNRFGLVGPAIGVVIGAAAHFLIQLPLAYRMGFRLGLNFKPDESVKQIGALAAPRILELSVLQVSKTVELYLASMISTAAYTYYTLANSVQLIPVGLFGVSLAKAALPTLTREADDLPQFRRTFLKTWYQVVFLVMPLATILVVLRIPVVRLLFGTNIFEWEATVQTGLVLSAFAVGVPFQASVMLLNRAFYALGNTKTPVTISLVGVTMTIASGVLMVLRLDYPTWALSVAFSMGVVFQAIVLFYALSRKLNGGTFFSVLPIIKSVLASICSGGVMFFFLKLFDRSVWVKRLSFVIDINAVKSLNFESFVLDTRYASNLLVLTGITAGLGLMVYVFVSVLLKSDELAVFWNVVKSRRFAPLPKKEVEQVAPSPEGGVEG